MGGKDGLVHVSEIRNERVENVRDALAEGQEVKVKVLEIDPRGKVRLSMRVVDQETGAELEDTRPPREPRERGDRGDRGDRGPRREGGGGGGGGGGEGRRDRGRGRGRERGDHGDRPRREGGPRPEREAEGSEPEFAPAFLTRDDG